MENEMITAIITASIAVIGSVLLASLGYWFTKKHERDASLRLLKLEYYKEFVSSLSGIMEGESTDTGQQTYARASNDLNLIANQKVLIALAAFRRGTKISNPDLGGKDYETLVAELFYEIRKDLGISPKDDQNKLKIQFWASGVKEKLRD